MWPRHAEACPLVLLLLALHANSQFTATLNESFSYHGQDVYLWDHFFYPMGYASKPGAFVELGGFDGVTGSNTLALERRGWSGVLLEPVPQNAELCQSSRAECWNKCVSNQPREWIRRDGSASQVATKEGLVRPSSEGAWIDCVGLDSALEAAALRRTDGGKHLVELLSLDVEGHEWQVLSTVSWERWHIDVILVEVPSEEKDPSGKALNEFKIYFAEKGYRYIDMLWNDAVFKKTILNPCPIWIASNPDFGFRYYLATNFHVTDYACPTEVMFFRILSTLDLNSVMKHDQDKNWRQSWLSFGTHNTLFHAYSFVEVHWTEFGGLHDYANIFGDDHLSFPNKGMFPTATFWLYHFSFIDAANSSWAVFHGLEELAAKFVDGAAVANLRSVLPDCKQGGVEKMDVNRLDVDLYSWTCGALHVALNHAKWALEEELRKHLQWCEILVKEYSRRFGLFRLLLAGMSIGLWTSLHAVQRKAWRGRMISVYDADG